jgi:hypothetical protein
MHVFLKVMGVLGLIVSGLGLILGYDRAVWFTGGTACFILIGVGFILGELRRQTRILEDRGIRETTERPEE